MTLHQPCCPVCGTPTPPDRLHCKNWCCSVPCYKKFWRIGQPMPDWALDDERPPPGEELTQA